MTATRFACALAFALAAGPALAQQPPPAPPPPVAPQAWAEPARPYLALQGAYVMPRDRGTTDGSSFEFDNGHAARIAVGSRFGLLRGEIEGGLTRYSVDRRVLAPISEAASGRFELWTLMANAYLDFPIGMQITPYVGAGIGAAHIRARNVAAPVFFSRTNDSDTVLAYQAMAGIGFQVAPQVHLTAGYRFFETGRPGFTDDIGGSYRINRPRAHLLEAGVRVEF
jgi:OmpA-OmpF porin, OOP family